MSEEVSAKTAEKCAAHPGRQAVAECEACGRPVCVICAIPVRGRVVGVECVVSVLGEHTQVVVARGWSRTELVAGSGLGLVAVASVLPWTRFGVGSAFLGGWDAVPSWSLLASVAGVVTFAVWWVVGRRSRRGGDLVAIAGGVVAAGAALLGFIHPPPFTKPWIGPVVALIGGVIAAGGAALDTRRAERVG
jgi:hypothetical protein